MIDPVPIALATIVLVGIGSQWLAWRTRIPSILLLLVGGFSLGNFTELIPDDLFGDLLFPVVSIAVALILFEGGLGLRYNEFREVGRTVLALVVTGMLVTGPLIAIAVHGLLGFHWDVAALFGAIFVVTGPTVILPLLEHIRPRGRAGAVLKWEGIVIDPIGAMLTVLVLEATRAGDAAEAVPVIVAEVVQTFGVGAAVGAAAAWLLALLFRRYLMPDQLHNPIVLMCVIVAFTVANRIQAESELFAAPAMGLLLANDRDLQVRHVSDFQEDLRTILLAGLFIVLGARIELDDIGRLGWESVVLLGLSIIVIRPLATAIGTLGSGLGWRERVFVASVAPRGVVAAAIASVLAIELADSGRASSDRFLAEAFFMVVGTVAFYGLAAGPIARVLRLGNRPRRGVMFVGAYPWVRELAAPLKGAGFDVLLVDTNRTNVRRSRLAGFRAEHSDVLDERIFERISEDEIGAIFVFTSNEDLNLLTSTRYSKVVGRSNVYKVAPQAPRAETAGRVFVRSDLTFSELVVRFIEGAKVQVNTFTERFGPKEFTKRYGAAASPAFLIGQDDSLSVYTTDQQPSPKKGDTVISIVEGRAARSEESRRLAWRRLRALTSRAGGQAMRRERTHEAL